MKFKMSYKYCNCENYKIKYLFIVDIKNILICIIFLLLDNFYPFLKRCLLKTIFRLYFDLIVQLIFKHFFCTFVSYYVRVKEEK